MESLRAFCLRTGYSWTTVKLVAARLGVNIPRRARSAQSRPHGTVGRHYAIDEDTAEKILADLLARPDGRRHRLTYRGEWGRGGKPEACVECEKTDRPHLSRGRCDRCDARVRRAEKRASVGYAKTTAEAAQMEPA